MPLQSQGPGATDATTTRTVDATDGPVPTALGTPEDDDASSALASATVIALLKALQHQPLLQAILQKLCDIEVILANQR